MSSLLKIANYTAGSLSQVASGSVLPKYREAFSRRIRDLRQNRLHYLNERGTTHVYTSPKRRASLTGGRSLPMSTTKSTYKPPKFKHTGVVSGLASSAKRAFQHYFD